MILHRGWGGCRCMWWLSIRSSSGIIGCGGGGGGGKSGDR